MSVLQAHRLDRVLLRMLYNNVALNDFVELQLNVGL
jgi:hypothetical protein